MFFNSIYQAIDDVDDKLGSPILKAQSIEPFRNSNTNDGGDADITPGSGLARTVEVGHDNYDENIAEFAIAKVPFASTGSIEDFSDISARIEDQAQAAPAATEYVKFGEVNQVRNIRRCYK